MIRNRRAGLYTALKCCGALGLALVFGVCGLLTPLSEAQAQIRAEVNSGVVAPTPIAVAPFSSPVANDVGANIAKVVAANLERSGFFRPIPPEAFIETSPAINVQPRFEDWRKINAQALVNGEARIDASGRLQVEFRLWDIYGETQMLGLQFTATPENWRRVAHKISDAIYTKMTGEKGYFDTRIVFVAESGSRSKRVKRLAIMDQDGANPSYLTDGSYTVLTPRFSANSQEITYMAMRADSLKIYLFNIETGRQETLGNFKGMVFAPSFSPDGSKVAFTVDQSGNSDIYIMDLRSRSTTRLTRDPGIDTSPSFSPDGQSLVFNSDRGGSPQLYVMNLDGSNVRRISFGSGRYSTPVWSPRGDLVVFTKQQGGRFHIGIMAPDGSNEKLLTSSYQEEGPTWAPNGRYIMFFREPPG
ncbi:MAG: Tol-Pal system beta propeller repeat protein TolB, partial [Asticcacaulis sp.]